MRARLTLYGRPWCHLCDDMLVQLKGLLDGFEDIEIEVVDVDSDPTVLARYDALVPVLVADGEELCHYHLDVAKVREYLGRFS